MKKPRVIVVGGGVSGSMSALKAAESGAEVFLFCRTAPRRSPSSVSHEAFNAPLDTKGENDSPSEHARDTIACGDFLAHQASVKDMCMAAPSLAHLFDRMGAVFARTSEGLLDLMKLPGSSRRRSIVARAGAGHQIASVLDSQLRRMASAGRIRLFEGWEFLSLVVDDAESSRGIVACDRSNMEIKAFSADAVIICSGGFAGIWGRRSAKPADDGAAVGVCYEQGAALANPEFLHISPFSVAGAESCNRVSPLMRAAGACIQASRDGTPWRFLEEWFPASRGMVTDDLALRALERIAGEESHGAEKAVFADFAGIDPDRWVPFFGQRATFLAKIIGDSPWEEPVRVLPAAAMTLGGLWVDRSHATSMKGLFAAGSAAAIYHGACALPGNELLASAFGGMVAGRAAAEFATGSSAGEAPASLLDAARLREEDLNATFAGHVGEENAHILARDLASMLSSSAFILKDNKELALAEEKIPELAARFERAELLDRSEWANSELLSMRAIKRSFALAAAVVAASRVRDESRGMHYKPAFPKGDDSKWLCTTRVSLSVEGPKLDFSERVDVADMEPCERES